MLKSTFSLSLAYIPGRIDKGESTCYNVRPKQGRTLISSVTTIVSTTLSSSAAGVLALLGVAGPITLIASLFMKESLTGKGLRFRAFNRNLDIITLPLFFVFSFIVSVTVWGILS